MIKRLSILGSTGSIGTSTLEVARRHPERFKVTALAAGNNIGLVRSQIEEFRPEYVSVSDKDAAASLQREYPGLETGWGRDGAVHAATCGAADTVVAAISGGAGLEPTMEAVRAGKDIALANKESLVLAGPLFISEVRRTGVKLQPVDSEHSAVFQSLSGQRRSELKRVILTASGGPFLNHSAQMLETVTPEEALRHPNWSMGRKITVDSATLMNKGLEVIEARWLFDLPPSMISVVVHPQSIIHSMAEYLDGSVIAQMSAPDMRGPIAYALSYPERIETGIPDVDFTNLRLDFREPDLERFPCLGLAYRALEMGGTAPAVLNAADEAAVALFLEGRIPFTGIPALISGVLDRHAPEDVTSIEAILKADRWARSAARSLQVE